MLNLESLTLLSHLSIFKLDVIISNEHPWKSKFINDVLP